MSYPSSLDLAFGSEKATADTISHADLSKSDSQNEQQDDQQGDNDDNGDNGG